MTNNNNIKSCYLTLRECLNQLENEIQNSLYTISDRIQNSDYELEKAKDFHCREILENICGIKSNLDTIVEHSNQLHKLNQMKQLNEDDQRRYSYVQSQVKSFSRSESNLSNIGNTKERRRTLENPLAAIAMWKTFLKDNSTTDFKVNRRNSTNRKNRKVVSSTIDFLESDVPNSTDSKIETLNPCILEEDESDGDYAEVYEDEQSEFFDAEDTHVQEIAEIISLNDSLRYSHNLENNSDAREGSDLEETSNFKPRVVDFVLKKDNDA